MSKGYLPDTLVDHHLQTAILSRLASAGGAVRFSDLKEAGIENSLFMYHANKLLRRGLIIKEPEGFRLTARGARWVNSVAPENFRSKPVALPLVQFVITDRQGNLLLCKRKGQLKELINEYVLPGGLHKAGLTAEENAHNLLEWWFPGMSPRLSLKTVAEVIHTFEGDTFVHHSLTHIFAVHMPRIAVPKDEDRFAFELMPLVAIQHDDPAFADSPFIPQFVAKLQNDSLKPREVFRIHHKE